jgi:hypothetical protein
MPVFDGTHAVSFVDVRQPSGKALWVAARKV